MILSLLWPNVKSGYTLGSASYVSMGKDWESTTVKSGYYCKLRCFPGKEEN